MFEIYTTLAISAFLSATLLPLGSEVVLIVYASQYVSPWFGLWLTASIANTLGSLLNWYLGKALLHFQGRRWFPVGPSQLHRAERWFGRYGIWSLLLVWLPVVGDPLCVVAGVLRIPVWRFILLVFLGKAARYAFVLAGLSLI